MNTSEYGPSEPRETCFGRTVKGLKQPLCSAPFAPYCSPWRYSPSFCRAQALPQPRPLQNSRPSLDKFGLPFLPAKKRSRRRFLTPFRLAHAFERERKAAQNWYFPMAHCSPFAPIPPCSSRPTKDAPELKVCFVIFWSSLEQSREGSGRAKQL